MVAPPSAQGLSGLVLARFRESYSQGIILEYQIKVTKMRLPKGVKCSCTRVQPGAAPLPGQLLEGPFWLVS